MEFENIKKTIEFLSKKQESLERQIEDLNRDKRKLTDLSIETQNAIELLKKLLTE